MKYSFFVLFVCLAMLSCRELVQDEFPDFEKSITVNSILVADSLLKVHVSYTDKLGDVDFQVVDNADITLTVDNESSEVLAYTGEGNYRSTILVEPGKTYQCLVNVPDFEPIVCVDSIPVASPILYFKQIKESGRDEEGKPYPGIQFTFKTNKNEKQYYQAIIRYNDHGTYQSADLKTIVDPVLLNEGLPIALFSNEIMEGEEYSMLLNFTTNSFHGRDGITEMDLNLYLLELRSVSEAYYNYVRSKYLYLQGRYPDDIAGTIVPSSLYSNIKDSQGIFAGYSVVRTDTIKFNSY